MPHRQHPEQQTVSFNYAPSFIIKMALFPKNKNQNWSPKNSIFDILRNKKCALIYFQPPPRKTKNIFNCES